MTTMIGQGLPGGAYDGTILTLLRERTNLSRSAIAEITGLSPTTVTKAVSPLIAAGFVEETGGGATRVGRPAIGLRLVPEAALVCALQIGVGIVRAGLVDALGRPRQVFTFPFMPTADAEATMTHIADRVKAELLADAANVIAVGVGAPGAVDAANRTNLLSVNLGWKDVPVADIMERICGLPTVVDHNVRAMAVAENKFGCRADSVGFVYVRTGVGLGLVLRGEPFLGGNHGVSELGHIQVASPGVRCICGAYGCLESVAAEPALKRQLAALGVPVLDEERSPLSLIEAVALERDDVGDLRDRLLRHVATGFANTVNLLNPDILVVGGMLSDASDRFLDELADATRKRLFPLLRDSLEIRRSSFGENAGVVGAGAVALEMLYYASATMPAPVNRPDNK